MLDNNFNIEPTDAVGLFKYKVIAPLLDADEVYITAMVKEISSRTFTDEVKGRQVRVSERTVYRWLSLYKKYGFNSLKPVAKGTKGKFKVFSKELIEKITDIKTKNIKVSARKIIFMLEKSGNVEKDMLKERTVSRLLNVLGYTRSALSSETRVYKKLVFIRINQLWQGDVCEKFHLYNKEGSMTKVYLIGFLDHFCKRFYGQFYVEANLARLMDVLKLSVTVMGRPDKIYLDNAKIYISDHFRLICARLGIRLSYSTPYHPEGKGAIEKFWQYLELDFLPDVRRRKISDIRELNEYFFAWLHEAYHNKPHEALDGLTPMQKWDESIKQGAKINFVTPSELKDVFLYREERKVSPYGVISLEKNTYEVDAALVGQKVEVRFDPFDLSKVFIYYKDKFYGSARLIDLTREKHSQLGNVKKDPEVLSSFSIDYLNILKECHREFIKSQVEKSLVLRNNTTVLDIPDSNIHDPDFKAPKDKDCSLISLKEFEIILREALSQENFTYTEKEKIHEIYPVFKEFGPDILSRIIQKLREENTDFCRNAFFYLNRIRLEYLELSKKKTTKKDGVKK
jgi:putative transposase